MEEHWEDIYQNVKDFSHQHKIIFSGICLFGAYTVAKHTLRSLCSFWRTFLRPSKDLFSRYQGGYVVITGATAGLGLEYAKQFAQKGFNLVLIARNEDKLLEAHKQILQYKNDVDIVNIVFDFDQPYTTENYQSLKDKLSLIGDISVLVNNVGTASRGEVENASMEDLNRMIQVNCIPQTILTKYLLPGMLQRSKEGRRCAIISISSVARYTKINGLAMYGATKSFNKSLSEVLYKELGEYIDVLVATPGPTKSNMYTKDGFFVIQPSQHVSWTLSDLGYEKETMGHYIHSLYRCCMTTPLFAYWYTASLLKK